MGFGRFTLVFVLLVLAGFGLFVYLHGRTSHPGITAAPVSSMAPLQPLPEKTVPGPLPGTADVGAPPDLAGLNVPELHIPGSDLAVPVSSSAPPAQPGDYVAELTGRQLRMPIENVPPKELYDSFNDARGGSKHEATDIMEPAGTPVHAIDEGNIAKLFTSKKGGLTIYQFDDARKYCFYYAHLDRYADNIKQGMLVRAGDVIGYVGSTGDANAASPHLHFAISLLGPGKEYWKGTPLNPYPVLLKLTGKALSGKAQ